MTMHIHPSITPHGGGFHRKPLTVTLTAFKKKKSKDHCVSIPESYEGLALRQVLTAVVALMDTREPFFQVRARFTGGGDLVNGPGRLRKIVLSQEGLTQPPPGWVGLLMQAGRACPCIPATRPSAWLRSGILC